MNQQGLVSIIIPCFNAERFVCDAVDSALAQTYPDCEIIVVDDGSTDQSVACLARYGSAIRVIQQENTGAAAARNLGLHHAGGEFVQFLDADDYLEPEKIALQLEIMGRTGADLVVCRSYIWREGEERIACGLYPDPTDISPVDYLLRYTLGTNGPVHRKEKLDRVGGFQEKLPRAQEWDLYIRLALNGIKLAKTDEILYTIRHHDGPRISDNRPENVVYLQNTLVNTIESALNSGIVLDHEQREALARYLTINATIAMRNSFVDTARRGFQYAASLSSRFLYEERPWLKTLARCVGPFRAEYTLYSLKRLLR